MRTKKIKIPVFLMYSMIAMFIALCLPTQVTQAKITDIAPPIATEHWKDSTVMPSGSGTEASPYIIDSAEKLAYLVGDDKWEFRKAYFLQTADIDLAGKLWAPIGSIESSANSIHYNGNGYKISNMTVIDGGTRRGLFSYVWNGVIENVNIVNPYILDTQEAGALVANAEKTTIRNCHVSGGYVFSTTNAGGLVGDFIAYSGRIENVTSSATVFAKFNAGGIVGYFYNQHSSAFAHKITNSRFYGDVESEQYAGSIIGEVNNLNNESVSLTLDTCYSDAVIRAAVAGGGIIGSITNNLSSVNLKNSGFSGDIYGKDGTTIGSMIGFNESAKTSITDCFGIADVYSGEVIPFGAENVVWGDAYSYVRQTKDATVEITAKYKITNDFKSFTYSKYMNGGFPFPTGMFAVGGFTPNQDVEAYLQSYGFGKYLLDIQTLPNSTYGTDKYVEMGKYPQTYVGSSMNTTLENWYSGKIVVDTYTVDNGTSATSNIYNAYTYTDGNTYVRVTAKAYDGDSHFEDGTKVTTGSAYWFKVEPIKWLILNYTDFQNGAAPIVVAERGLTSNVTWNKATADQNLWSGTSNIRTWLNGTFYNDAFNSGDKGNIVNTTLQNNSQSSDTDGTGVSTTDKVWLLSNNEAFGKYFTTNTQRIAKPSDFCAANNAVFPNSTTSACYYWLRSAYQSNSAYALYVFTSGSLSAYTVSITYSVVRPALKLSL